MQLPGQRRVGRCAYTCLSRCFTLLVLLYVNSPSCLLVLVQLCLAHIIAAVESSLKLRYQVAKQAALDCILLWKYLQMPDAPSSHATAAQDYYVVQCLDWRQGLQGWRPTPLSWRHTLLSHRHTLLRCRWACPRWRQLG